MNAEIREATKKPVTIQYMVWPGGADNATPVINWVLENGGTATYYDETEHISINTLEGHIYASPGDVVIRGVQGEFYPCKPDIFRETYDIGRVVES